MVFHKRLFVNENIENEAELIACLEDNIAVFNLYLICVSKKSRNMFDILSSSEYFKEINKDREYITVGLAFEKKGAVELLERIFLWWLDGRNDLDGLKRYFLS